MENLETERRWSFVPSTFALIVAVAVMMGYAAGMRNDEIVGAVAPVLGFKVETGKLDLVSVQSTYRQLMANYDGVLSKDELINGASRGLVEAAGDDYTMYMDREEAEEFNKDLTGDIGGGIGAEIGSRNYKPTVIRILPDTPASKSQLRVGDAIVAVNEESTATWSIDDTVSKIRGKIGTTVKLRVQRGTAYEDVSITRAKITAPSVVTEIKDGIGIMTLWRFDETTAGKAKAAAREFVKRDVKGVILDLRGNGGGLLSAAQDVASIWLRNKVVVSERHQGRVVEELKSGFDPILSNMPTVVLVDGSSASASEIVAGALQDHGAATLVGEKTYGKGSVQKLIDLPRGAVLKVTIAKWYTPKGKNIDEEGIKPDKKIELTADDANANRDLQLNAAIKILE